MTHVGRAASPVGRPSRLSRNRALRIGELGADHLLASRNGRRRADEVGKQVPYFE